MQLKTQTIAVAAFVIHTSERGKKKGDLIADYRRQGCESDTDACGPHDCYLDYCTAVTPVNSASLFATISKKTNEYLVCALIDCTFIDIVNRVSRWIR